MAVKRNTVQAPPIWKSGGKEKNYCVEVLEAQRALIFSRVKEARKEKYFYKFPKRVKEVRSWEVLAEYLTKGITLLKMFRPGIVLTGGSAKDRAINKKILGAFVTGPAGKSYDPKEIIDPSIEKAAADVAEKAGLAKPAQPPAPEIKRTVRANCKNFAKCGEYSYTYCFSKCEKRKDGTCKLIRGAHTKSKNMAKCGDNSYWYCFTKCKKRKNKKCNLVRKYTRGKGK